MATAIFFGGRRINIPGAYSEIDASALASLAPGAVGIVALIGTAEGGKPLTIESEFSDATTPERAQRRYRSGDLRVASDMAFSPSTDPAVPGGAQRLVNVKVNPATQSAATLPDDNAADSADLLAKDWGQFTEQYNIEVEAGTLSGKLYTVVFEDTEESFDNVGASAVFDVSYAPGANGYDTINALVDATQFLSQATKADTGLLGDLTAQMAASDTLEVLSSAAGDTTQTLTVYGLDASDAPIKVSFALDGTTIVPNAQIFKKVTGAVLDAAAVGTVTLQRTTGPTTVLTLAPASTVAGLEITTNTPAAGVATVAIDVDTAVDVVVRGLGVSGAEVAERFDMTAGATTPVVGTTVFSAITQVELGDVAGARTVTVSIDAALTAHSTFKTTAQVADKLNSLAGFTANSVRRSSFLMTDCDYRPAATILSATVNIFADLFDFISVLNTSSQFIGATRATGASLPPANTAAPVYLTGGVEGTPTITQWQEAFTLLKKRRVNTIVPLTEDAAIHALLASHLVERAGKLRSEANGYVGLGTVAGAGDTKSNIITRIQNLSTRHISAIAEEPQRFDIDTGEPTFYPPHFYGAIQAGMQAGSPVGEPLTHKKPSVTDRRNDSSWDVSEDQEELVDAGLWMTERVDGVGIRNIRSITTHLADDNVVFTEMSANESANISIFELRRQLELFIGKRGLGGTVATIKGKVFDELERQIVDEIIVAFRSVTVEQIGDTFPVSAEIAPVLPINFIPITVHLVAVRTAA
jgi:hypothetical protein